MNDTQQTSLIIQEDYLELAIQSSLMAKQSENLTAGSVKFYKDKLDLFLKFCEGQEIKLVSQVTPNTIRELLILWQSNHKAGGAHSIYRSLKAFLNWYWDEVEPDGKNPIKKVPAPKVDLEPLDPADIGDVEKMIVACPNDTLAGRRDKALMYFIETPSKKPSNGKKTRYTYNRAHNLKNRILPTTLFRLVHFACLLAMMFNACRQCPSKEGFVLLIQKDGYIP